MTPFFMVTGFVFFLLYLCSLVLGHFGTALQITSTQHMLLGLMTAVVGSALHCLIFAIFTGSGKDIRLLTEDLQLQSTWHARAKAFKRDVFPPALYAIGLLILVVFFGALRGRLGSGFMVLLHPILAWGAFLYNLKVFILEVRAVRENAVLLRNVNQAASQTIRTRSDLRDIDQLPSDIEWGTHVYALGKFLMFLGYNVWLPYFYFRFVMAKIQTPWWPFLIACCLLLVSGWRIKKSYAKFAPTRLRQSVAH